mmetsp:Transcript_21894/g.35117  ORF Transcript_21894/g.35117 Transcript_21894/m.35117 type:complete len:457 (+) Transcript_21894:138-1508(+)
MGLTVRLLLNGGPQLWPVSCCECALNEGLSSLLDGDGDHDALHFRVVLERVLALVPAPARLLVASERARHVEVVVAVDPNGARLELLGHGKRVADVPGADAGSEAVHRAVGAPNRLIVIFEGQDLHDGPKDLLLADGHRVRDAREDGRRDEVALGAHPGTAQDAGGALGLADLNEPQNLVELNFVDLGAKVADGYGGGKGQVDRAVPVALGRALPKCFGESHHLGGEGLGDLLVDEDATRGDAALAHVQEEPHVRSGCGLVQVGVLAHDQRGLAAELEGHLFEVGLRGRRDDLVADERGAGEGHFADAGVPGNQVARRVAVAVDDVDRAGGEARLVEQVAKHQHGQGRLLTQLEHRRAAHGEGRAQLPRGHEQGEIPGDDLAANADGLVRRVGEGGVRVMGRHEDLAADLVRPAGIVAKALDHVHDVDRVGDVPRLAVVPALYLSKLGAVLFNQVG